MKKIISFVAILVLALVVTGCSKNKILECTIDQSSQLNGNGSMKGTFLFHFKDTSLEKAEIKEIWKNYNHNYKLFVIMEYLE